MLDKKVSLFKVFNTFLSESVYVIYPIISKKVIFDINQKIYKCHFMMYHRLTDWFTA